MFRSSGFFCSDGMCIRESHGSSGLTIDVKPDSSSSSSYSAPVAYSVKGGKEGGGDYVGYGGAICTISDIQKATNVMNALNDSIGIGNQIYALLATLFDNIRFECSAENISSRCQTIKSNIDGSSGIPVVCSIISHANFPYPSKSKNIL